MVSYFKIFPFQDNSDDDHSPPNKKSGMRGVPWKHFTIGSSTTREKGDPSMGKNASGSQGKNSEQIRKSKRVPKRRVLDGAFDEEDEDDEIRYLEKLKFSKVAAVSKGFEEDSRKKQQQISRVSKNTKRDAVSEDYIHGRSSKKSRSERGSEGTDYEEEEEVVSDGGGPDVKKKKKPRNDSIDSLIESKRDSGLTTRQRALLSGKDDSSVSGTSVVEFPNGLPPAPPRS